MIQVMVHHQIQDYAKWYTLYAEQGTTRKSAGCKGSRLFRDADTLNKIVLLFDWDTLENARRFIQSSDLRTVMEKAGVIGQPDIVFL